MVSPTMSSTSPRQTPAERRAAGVIITHPNRDKAVVQSTRAIVILLMLVTAALVAVVTIGGWSVLQGALPVQLGYIVVYLLLAFYAARWNRGVLPISAALAVLLASSRWSPDLAGLLATRPALRSLTSTPGCSACSRC